MYPRFMSGGKKPDVEEVIHDAATVKDALEVVSHVGEGARTLLEGAGLWDTVVQWLHGSGATTAAAALPIAGPFVQILAPVLAFVLYRKNKAKHAKAEEARREVTERTAQDVAAIKKLLESLITENASPEDAAVRMAAIVPGRVDGLEGLVQIDRGQLHRLETEPIADESFAHFLDSLRSEMRSILDAIAKSDHKAHLRHHELMKSLERQSDMLATLLGEGEHSASRIAELEAEIKENLAEIDRLRRTNHLPENQLERALVLTTKNRLAEARSLFEEVADTHDDAYVQLHVGLGDIALRECKFADAESEFRRAMAARADDAEVLIRLGWALHYGGKPIEARQLARRLVEFVGDDLDDHLCRRALHLLAEAEWEMGAKVTAHAMAQRLIESAVNSMGERDGESLHYMNSAANPRRESPNDLRDWATIQAETCAQVFGDSHPDTLHAKRWLALAPCESREQKVDTLRELTRRSAEFLGANHPLTLQLNEDVASIYLYGNWTADARRILQRVYDARKEVLGELHPHTLRAMVLLAASLRQGGNGSSALPLEEFAVGARVKVLGACHPDTIALRSEVGKHLFAAGRQEESLQMLLSAASCRNLDDIGVPWKIFDAVRGGELEVLANYCMWSGRYDEAVPWLQRLLSLRCEYFGEASELAIETMKSLAGCYVQLGRAAEGAKLLLEATELGNNVH